MNAFSCCSKLYKNTCQMSQTRRQQLCARPAPTITVEILHISGHKRCQPARVAGVSSAAEVEWPDSSGWMDAGEDRTHGLVVPCVRGVVAASSLSR